MTPEFDPYYKWLGIPSKDQPPNHYRLLSIEQLEDDSEVIDSAANRLMSYMHELASGDRPEASQQLLNEISEARRCLLNPERKAAYDKQLKQKLPAKKTPKKRSLPKARHLTTAVKAVDSSEVPATDGPVPLGTTVKASGAGLESPCDPLGIQTPVPVGSPATQPQRLQSVNKGRKSVRRKNDTQLLAYAMLGVVLVVGGVAAYTLLGDPRINDSETTDTAPAFPDEQTPPPPVVVSSDKTNSATSMPKTDDSEPTIIPLGTQDPKPTIASGTLREVRELISQDDYDAAKLMIEEYLKTAAGQGRRQAMKLLVELRLVNASDDAIVEFLAEMPAAQFEKLRMKEQVALVSNKHLLSKLEPRFQENFEAAKRKRSDPTGGLGKLPGQKPDKPKPDTTPPDEPEEIVLTVDQARSLLAEKGLKSQSGDWVLVSDTKYTLGVKKIKKSQGAYRQFFMPIYAADYGSRREQRRLLESLKEKLKGVNENNIDQQGLINLRNKRQLEGYFKIADANARKTLRPFVDSFSQLTLSILHGESLEKKVLASYRNLNKDPSVQAALKALATSDSPVKSLKPSVSFEASQKHLAAARELVLVDYCPMAKGKILFIANEATAVPFELEEKLKKFSLITSDTAARLNIEVPEGAPDVTVGLARKGKDPRTLLGPAVTIKSLRVGQNVIKDVPAIVLRVGDSDLGNVLSQEVFTNYNTSSGKYLFVCIDPLKKRDVEEK